MDKKPNADNVVLLGNVKEDNTIISPINTLREAIKAIENGEISPNKLMVISLDTEPRSKNKSGGGYYTNWFLSNLKSSESVALLEVIKQEFLSHISGIS